MKSTTPAYYKSLSLGNFRGFKKAIEIQLAPLTFLVGPNSSGKSSISDAFLLLTQSNVLPAEETSLVPKWVGPLVDLGNYNDTVFGHSTSLAISITVEISLDSSSGNPKLLDESRYPVKFEFHIRSSPNNLLGYIASIRVIDSLSNEQMILHFQLGARPKLKLEYLGLIRELPLDSQLSDIGYAFAAHEIEQTIKNRGASMRGRKAAWRRLISYLRSDAYYDYFREFTEGTQRVSSGRAAPRRWFLQTVPDELLPNSLRKIFDGVYPAMVEAVDINGISRNSRQTPSKPRSELKKILKQLDIATNIFASHPSHYHSTINIKDNMTKITSNLIDVGYGASQVIPVITACTSNRVGPLFVEQPEIHLHPKAQGTIAELLCDTSLRRQVVVETHSVHMINRARLLIAKGILDHKKVIINYVSRTAKGSQVDTIPIKENGDFEADWPEGFFDERYEETMALLQLKSKGEKD